MRKRRMLKWMGVLIGVWIMRNAAAAAEPESQSPQASNLAAFFRAGQTFLTWNEIPGENVQYRMYRSLTPIASSEDLESAQALATVEDWTSLNLMASINRLEISLMPRDATYVIPDRVHFVIDEQAGPLPDDTGLFVYTAKGEENAYYAVTAVVNGEENIAISAGEDGNALAGMIAEKIELPAPIKQNDEGDYAHWVDNVGTPLYPAMGGVPGIPYNFRLHVPEGEGSFPLVGVLHGAYFQYNTPDELRFGKILSAEDEPTVAAAFDSPNVARPIEGIARMNIPGGGWHGFNSHLGTDKPESEGETVDYVVRRVLWTLDWIAQTYPVDTDRVGLRGESMGGMGTLQIGLMHPERFAAIHTYAPSIPAARSADGEGGEGGRPSFLRGPSYVNHLNEHPDIDFPFILVTGGRLDNVVGWPDKPRFMEFAQERLLGAILYWDGRWHSYELSERFPLPPVWNEPDGRMTKRLSDFSLKESYPALSGLTANNDPGQVNLATRPPDRPPLDSPGVGDIVGTINGAVDWDRETIIDTAKRYEITLRLNDYTDLAEAFADVTPRRLQAFHPEAGSPLRFSVVDSGNVILKEGEVQADEWGRAHAKSVPISKDGCRLAIWIESND